MSVSLNVNTARPLFTNVTNPSSGGKTYTFVQNSAASTWNIYHNLRKFPSVTVVDSAGSVVIGDVTYLDNNSLVISFTGAFSGRAYLN